MQRKEEKRLLIKKEKEEVMAIRQGNNRIESYPINYPS